jgi:hypothetical protein
MQPGLGIEGGLRGADASVIGRLSEFLLSMTLCYATNVSPYCSSGCRYESRPNFNVRFQD